MRAMADPFRWDADSRRAQLADQAFLAIATRCESEGIRNGVTDERDLSVAERDEMARGEGTAGHVVADDARHAGDGRRVDVDEHDRDKAAAQRGDCCLR